MPKVPFSIMRLLRIQLKTGYLAEAPASYTFMRRYPPVVTSKEEAIKEFSVDKVPYVKFYREAVNRNPLYADDRIYPAYWEQEPLAMILAKKQYELVQKGMGEEDAYKEAVAYVDRIESKSYESLHSFLEEITKDGATRKTFASDSSLAEEVENWRSRLLTEPYGDMSLADQGELDFMIQTKVLKWNEVERERRMRDPVFYLQFEKLRLAIFPEIEPGMQGVRERGRDEAKRKLMTFFELSEERLCTMTPFYFEDYARFFEQVKSEPLLSLWSEMEMDSFSRWIVDCLAYREVMEKSNTAQKRRYLDRLRAYFFPMVQYPDRAAEFSLPSEMKMKELLYTNDIGYKRDGDEGKLYVKRFYKIPLLLFPKETLATSIVTNGTKLKAVLSEDEALLREIGNVGLNETSLPELKKELEKYTQSASAHMVGLTGAKMEYPYGRESTGIDMSALDTLLSSYNSGNQNSSMAMGKDTSVNKEIEKYSNESEIEGEEEEGQIVGEFAEARKMKEEDWLKVVDRYVKKPDTKLLMDREAFFSRMDLAKWQEADHELELEQFRRARVENEILLSVKLADSYERKEAARRVREWKRRGVYSHRELPKPEIELINKRHF